MLHQRMGSAARLVATVALAVACAQERMATDETPARPIVAPSKPNSVSTHAGLTTIDLGILAGGEYSGAFAINQLGTITGFSANAFAGPAHLVRWKRGGAIEDLGQIAAGMSTFGLGIDDGEEIVGSYGPPGFGGFFFPQDYGSPGERAFYWNGVSGFQKLPGQGPSRAKGIQRINNGTRIRIVGCDAGKVAIWADNGTGFTLSTPPLPSAWRADSSCAEAVGPKGDFVGRFRTSGNLIVDNAFRWSPVVSVGYTQLSHSGGSTGTEAWGQATSRIVGSDNARAVLWSTAKATPIFLTPPSQISDQATGVNNRTEVVGFFGYWNSDAGLLALPDVAGNLPGNFVATGINDTAEVVGWSRNAAGLTTATLWLPRDTAAIVLVKQLPFDTTTHLPPKVSYIPRNFINDGIISRPGFDATQLDPNVITLGDGLGHITAIARTARGLPMAVATDVNGDGVLDLKVRFSKAQLIADGVLAPASYQFEIAFVGVTGLPIKTHYPIWVQ